MHGLNQYDYAARYYDPAYIRFTTMDPMMEKYYSISPYVYVANNPMKFIDPGGRVVKIYYLVGEKNQAFSFDGSNYRSAPNNEFVQAALKSYKYNVENGGGESMKALAENKDITVKLVETQYENNTHRGGNVFWSPRYASKTADGKAYSPATILEHEMSHAESFLTDHAAHTERQNTYDKQYDNTEEKRVITGPEAKTAQANGEFPKNYVRPDHKEHGHIRVNDPTSITPMPPKAHTRLVGKRFNRMKND